MISKEKVLIPRVIMQTWKTNVLPDHWKPSQASIYRCMNDWKYVLMTDDNNRNFVKEHFPDFIDTYDSFPYNIQRVDAVRYAWLFINGGIYMDCDIELLGNIDHLFMKLSQDIKVSGGTNSNNNKLFVVPSANNSNVYTNAFIAATPRHPVFLSMMEDMKSSTIFKTMTKIEMHWHIMESTGPMMFTRIVKQLNEEYIIIDASVLNPYTICDVEYNRPNALMRPLCGSSWVGPVGVIWQTCYCYRHILISIAIVLMMALVYFLVKNMTK